MKAWLLALLVFAAGESQAQEAGKRGPFTDPQDGKVDASEWLLDRKGFLPVPILITEPAVGYGAGASLLFFRESIGERVEKAKETGHLTPPDIYALALAATENGTRFGGAGGMTTFDGDRWRWRGGVALTSVNLDFYGEGGKTGTADRKIGYNLDGLVSSQQVMRRIGETNGFIAGRWVYLDLQSTFDPVLQRPILPDRSSSARSSGLGLAYEYDSRDNIFTPSRGWIGNLDATFYSPDFGGDTRFQKYRAHVFSYFPLAKDQFVLATRLDVRAVNGEVPFYQLPYVELRGLPAGRYQDERTGVAEAELRWNATERWAAIGFVGAGRAWGSSTNFGDAGNVYAKGIGFRYLIARRLGFYMGADIARGPETTAFYIQAGSAWR